MSLPALTVAMLLGNAPVNSAATPPPVSPPPVSETATNQVVQMAEAPAAQADLPPPAATTQAAPPPEPGAAPTSPAPGPTAPQAPASSNAPGSGANKDEIIVTGRPKDPGDPLEKVNVEAFKVTQEVDKAIVGPVAMAYKETVPRTIRKGFRNFLNNLGEPVVFLNFLLQLKPGKAAETLGRFAVNSTFGIAGVIDTAKRCPFNLPRRSNGFANTLGYYGVKPGPYFYLPLAGATTLRDLLGTGLDRLVFPALFGKPFNDPKYVIPSFVIRQLDDRAEFDEQLKVLRDKSPDPYAAMRKYYLENRQAEIDALHGKPSATNPASPPAEPCRSRRSSATSKG